MIRFILLLLFVTLIGAVGFFAIHEIPAPQEKVVKALDNEQFYKKSREEAQP